MAKKETLPVFKISDVPKWKLTDFLSMKSFVGNTESSVKTCFHVLLPRMKRGAHKEQGH